MQPERPPLGKSWDGCVRNPDDAAAWENFLVHHRGLLTRIVLRVASRFGAQRTEDVHDAVQEVCLSLSAKARAWKPLKGDDQLLERYLRASIANTAHDFFRARYARKRDRNATIPLQEALISDAELDLNKDLLLQQLKRIAGKSARDREVFMLYFQQGWTASEIAAIPALDLTTKGVESAIHRIASVLKERVGSKKKFGAKGFSAGEPY